MNYPVLMNKDMSPKKEFDGLLMEKEGCNPDNFIYLWNGKEDVQIPNKCKSLNFLELFLRCPVYSRSHYTDNDSDKPFYEINWNGKHVACKSTQDNSILLSFLAIRFIHLMDKLLQGGLKKDYVIKEGNLHSKKKGRILFSQHLKKNIIQCRKDFFFCSYQEYTEDIPVNRFLKYALSCCRSLMCPDGSLLRKDKVHNEIINKINRSFSYMNGVGTALNPYVDIRNMKVPRGKMYSNYEECIRLAKEVVQLDVFVHSYQGNNTEKKVYLPQFWIYLPSLFEHYVYGKLLSLPKGYELKVQPKGWGKGKQRADFILTGSSDMVIDAKFKYWYNNDSLEKHAGDFINDIRELAGYARDMEYFPKCCKEVACIIVYPTENSVEEQNGIPEEICQIFRFNPAFTPIQAIRGFRDFYKVGISLPKLQ